MKSRQPILLVPLCTALVRLVLLMAWEICFLSMIALLIIAPDSSLWHPFAVACLTSFGLDVMSALGRWLRRDRST